MDREPEQREQRILLLSAAGTLALSLVGIVIGLWTGAKSIVFDGMYDMVDAGMTLSAWFAARLIARGNDRRFQYGYWHIEPMLAFLNGSILLFACFYAFIDGISVMLAGGRTIALDVGIVYAATGAVVSFSVYLMVDARRRGLESMLLQLDARAWLLGALLSSGLCVAFVLAALLKGTAASPIAGYVDPAILIILALVMAPLPARTLLSAGREILQIAPPDLDEKVRHITAELAFRHGFVEYQSYVTKVGRVQFIEIGFVAPSAEVSKKLGELDLIREEFAEALGGLKPDHWLTVDFTADRQWI
jgi:predicted Co/Zn/Cd cation transporter (cation efflux family)